MEENVVTRVINDFLTTADGELSISKGEIVQVLKKVDRHWCYGFSGGRLGNVPSKCLMVIDTPPIEGSQMLFVAQAHFPSTQTGDLSFSKGDIIIGLKEVDSNWWQGEIDGRIGIFPITYTWKLDTAHIQARNTVLNVKARVKMNMKAMLEDEMDLVEGEMVTITQIIDKNWYRGKCGNRSGTFPSAYVAIIEDPVEVEQSMCNQYENSTTISPSPETPPLMTFSPDKDQAAPISKPNYDIHDVLDDDYFKLNMPTVFQHQEMPHETVSISIDSREIQPCQDLLQSDIPLDIVPYGISLYPFHAQFENELGFEEGEIVNIIRHIDLFWMEGKIDNKKGIFPTNYIDIVVDCEGNNLVDLASSNVIAEPQVLAANSFATVLYNFDAQMNSDLTVKENQVVMVLGQESSEWCRVKDRGGNVGLCPWNHLGPYLPAGDRRSIAEDPRPPVQEAQAANESSGKLHRSHSLATEKAGPAAAAATEPAFLSRNTKRTGSDRVPHRPAPPAPAPGHKPMPRALPRPALYKPRHCTKVDEAPSCIKNQNESNGTDSSMQDCRSKSLEHRQNVISELVFTEKEYVRDLKITYETFNLHNPSILESRGVDVKALFGNFLEVVHQAENLLEALQLAMKGKADEDQCVGPCFLDAAEGIKTVYGTYCMNHENALSLLEKYEANPGIQALFEKGLETLRYQIACFNMGSILIKPVQRILKYPLILNELIKCTEPGHRDMPKLLEAVKTITRVASYINECKRRKDIVNKYLEEDNPSITSKMSRLSLHSVAKKSTRLSVLLTSTLGFGVTTKDPVFAEHESMFHGMEKTVAGFLRNVDGLLICVHEQMQMELDIAQGIALFYHEANTVVEHFHTIQQMVNNHFWPHFKQMVESRVEAPLFSLLELFRGPSILVQKRNDKLLDYDGCASRADKNKENRLVQDELFNAKNNYEALNNHLLEELPVLIQLGSELFVECLGAFVTARMLLSGKITKQYLALLEKPSMPSAQGDVLETFAVKHALAVNQLSRFSFAAKPGKSDTLSRRTLRKSPTPVIKATLPLPENNKPNAQSPSQRAYLQSRYPPEVLHSVTVSHTASEPLQLTLQPGHLVAVIKKQNPMGDPSLWFVHDGSTQGFVPSRCLQPLVFAPGDVTLGQAQPAQSQPAQSQPAQSQPALAKAAPVPRGKSREPDVLDSGLPPSYEQVMDPSQHLYAEIPEYAEPPAIYSEAIEEPVSEFYYALYDFAGDSSHALQIASGQMLNVIYKHDQLGNSEWWFVEDRFGSKGYVPGNFLEKYTG